MVSATVAALVVIGTLLAFVILLLVLGCLIRRNFAYNRVVPTAAQQLNAAQRVVDSKALKLGLARASPSPGLSRHISMDQTFTNNNNRWSNQSKSTTTQLQQRQQQLKHMSVSSMAGGSSDDRRSTGRSSGRRLSVSVGESKSARSVFDTDRPRMSNNELLSTVVLPLETFMALDRLARAEALFPDVLNQSSDTANGSPSYSISPRRLQPPSRSSVSEHRRTLSSPIGPVMMQTSLSPPEQHLSPARAHSPVRRLVI